MFPHPVCFYFHQHFHIEYLKMAARAVLHFSIALQRTNIVPGTKIVCRTAKKSCGECSPEFTGKLSLQISISNFGAFFMLSVPAVFSPTTKMYFICSN